MAPPRATNKHRTSQAGPKQIRSKSISRLFSYAFKAHNSVDVRRARCLASPNQIDIKKTKSRKDNKPSCESRTPLREDA